jgi:hypothetical protein
VACLSSIRAEHQVAARPCTRWRPATWWASWAGQEGAVGPAFKPLASDAPCASRYAL